MKKNNRLGLYITLAVAVGGGLLYFWLRSDSKKHYQWYESYNALSDEPYGTSYLKNLLSVYRPESKLKFNTREPLTRFLSPVQEHVTDYLFVGREFYLSDADALVLLKFVEHGNNAFIASEELPANFLSQISNDSCVRSMRFQGYEAATAEMNFFHESLRTSNDTEFTRRQGMFDGASVWRVLNIPDTCSFASRLVPLGFQTAKGVNFFKVPYGNGFFYFHTAPLVFTNFFLAKKNDRPYTEKVLSHLTGHDILWDEFSKLPELPEKGKSSPLYFILQQPALKYAWWLLLATVILYVCFAAKREQRVIPVLEPKINTSLEFVNLIAALHFQNGNPIDMARKKMRYFLYFVRSKYGIQATSFGPEQITQLAAKSTVPLGEVTVIFDRFNALEKNTNIKSQSEKLLDLFYAIENFNSKCR